MPAGIVRPGLGIQQHESLEGARYGSSIELLGPLHPAGIEVDQHEQLYLTSAQRTAALQVLIAAGCELEASPD